MAANLTTSITLKDNITSQLKNIGKAVSLVATNMKDLANIDAFDPSDLAKMQTAINGMNKSLDDLEKEEKRAAEESKKHNASLRDTNSSADILSGTFKKLAAAVGTYVSVSSAIAGVKKAIDFSDEVANMTGRLNLVVDSFNQLGGAAQTVKGLKKEILEAANATGSSYTETENLVASIGNNAKDAFSSTDEMLKFAENLQKTFIVSGASTEDMNNATRQLLQGLSAGALRGDELNSVMENAPELVNQIALAMGVPRGEVRALAAEGKITADVLKAALIGDAAANIDARFEAMPKTFSRVFQVFKNDLYSAFEPVGEALTGLANNEEFGAAIERIGKSIMSVVPNIVDFINRIVAFAPTVANFAANAFEWLVDHGDTVVSVLGAIVGGFVALKAASTIGSLGGISNLFSTIISQGGNALNFIKLLGSDTSAALSQAGTGILSMLGSIASKALALINPVTLAIAAVVGLVGAITALTASGATGADVTSWFDNFNNGVNDFVNRFNEFVTNLVSNISTRLPEIMSRAGEIGGALVTGLLSAIPTLIGAAGNIVLTLFTALMQALPTIITSGMNFIGSFITGILQGLPQIASSALDMVITFGNNIAQNLPTIIQSGIQAVSAFIAGLAQQIPNILTAAVQMIAGFVQTFVDHLPEILQMGYNLIGGLITGLINGIPDFIVGVLNIIVTLGATIIQNLPTIIQSGIQIVSAIVQGIWNMLPTLMNCIGNLATQIWNALMELGNNIWTKMQEFGSNIVAGLREGVNNAWSSFWEWITSKFTGVVDWVKNFFGIASPSTVFSDIGGNLLQGLWNGMQNIWGGLTSWVQSAWDGLLNIFNGGGQDQQLIDYTPQIESTRQQLELLRQTVDAGFRATLVSIQAAVIQSLPGIQAAFTAQLALIVQAAGAMFQTLIPAFNAVLQALQVNCAQLLLQMSAQGVQILMNMGVYAAQAAQVLANAVIMQFGILVAQVAQQFLMMLQQINVIMMNIAMVAQMRSNIIRNNILNVLRLLPADMYTIATQMLDMFALGIADRTKQVVDATDALVQAVKAAFVKGLGIHSPSRIAYYYGQMTGTGFINGLSDKQIAEFAKNTINEIIDAFVAGKFSADELVDFLDDDTLKVIDYIKADPELMAKSTISGGGWGSASGVIGAAQKYIGYQSGSDRHSQFESRYGVNGAYWCAMFVKAMADEAGIPWPAIWSVPSLISWAQANGRWSQTPAPGDAVTFRGGAHVGLVESVNADGSITTIEGNTLPDAGQAGTWGVWRKHHTSNIDGYIKMGSPQAGAAVAAGAGMATTAQNAGLVKANGTTITYPLQGGPYTITSTFGGRASPGGIGSTNHQGIDIGAGGGTPILSALPGIVETAAYSGGYGNLVVVNHGNGLKTYYGHMSAIKIAKGNNAAAGQLLGLVGSTGNSTGNHLHFGMMVNGEFIDPMPYLQGGLLTGFGISLVDVLQAAYNKKKGITAAANFDMANLGAFLNTAGSGIVEPDWFKSWTPPAEVARWAPTVLQALAILGEPASLLKGVLWAINGESGGDPNNINTWDSNAAIGDPTKGLLQIMMANFKPHEQGGWGVAGYTNNIWDPLENILTGLGEMKWKPIYAKQGGIAGVINRRLIKGHWEGYAVGTRNATPGFHLVGETGPELVQFGGGERVFTAAETRSMMSGSGTTLTTVNNEPVINVNVNVDHIDSQVDIDNMTDQVISRLNTAIRNTMMTSPHGLASY